MYSRFCLLFLIVVGLFAETHAESKRLRDPSPKETPCGFYLSSMAHDTNGVKVADFDAEEFRLAVRANRSAFEPRITYVHRLSGRAFQTAEGFKQAFEEGNAEPILDFPIVAIVGNPILGNGAKSNRQMAEQVLQEEGIEHYGLLILNRPVQPSISSPGWLRPGAWALEKVHLGFQNIVYQFPLFGADKQKPQLSEIKSMKGKLITANTVQQLALYSQVFFPMSPTGALTFTAATAGGMINYTNSYFTGKYRKFISNWFNRSRNEAERFAKNAILSTFFIVEMHSFKTLVSPALDFVMHVPASFHDWAQYLPMEFLDLASAQPEAWKELAVAKWFSGVLNIGWRYFYYKAIHGFERRLESEGRIDDARRTAARFEWFGTALATPAFLYSIFAPKDAGIPIEVLGHHLAQLNYGHLGMALVGATFAAFHYGLFKMDPWVDRFDRIHEGVKSGARAVSGLGKCIAGKCLGAAKFVANGFGLEPAVDRLESYIRSLYERNYESDRDSEVSPPVASDIQELMGVDPRVSSIIENDPALVELVARDRRAHELIENDPRFKKVVGEEFSDQTEAPND